MRYPRKWQLAFVCLLVLALLPFVPAPRGTAQAPGYTVTDLGTLGVGEQSRAFGLDECGRVVGESQAVAGPAAPFRPFLWNNGVLTDLGTLGGQAGTAVAVNQSGTVIGSAQNAGGTQHPFVRPTPGPTPQDIGTLGGPTAEAYDINASGQVVGVSEENGGIQDRAFIWESGTGMRGLTAPWGTPIRAFGINNAGQIAGTANHNVSGTHAFVTVGGVALDLGTLGGGVSFATEVNDSGEVSGYSYIYSDNINQPFHAFYWKDANGNGQSDPGEMQDLGTLGGRHSYAYDINNSGLIVGRSETALDSSDTRAIIWTSTNGLQDLNDVAPGTGWTFQEAHGVNDRGQIVGFGLNPQGKVRAFLLTPTNVGPSPCDATPTPTPVTTPTPTPTPPSGVNHALASNGATATASSSHNSNYPAAAVNNGDRRGVNWNAGGGWNDATPNAYPDWVEVSFPGWRSITEVSVFTLQDSPGAPSEPTEAMTFASYGVTNFEVQYWDGAAWLPISGAAASGNNKVWRKFTFSAVTASKVRVLVTGAMAGYSRLTEVEAWGPAGAAQPPAGADRANHALSANGGAVTASSAYDSNYPAASVINGDRRGLNWNSGGGWNDATPNSYPDWVEVSFPGWRSVNEVSVFTLQDSPGSPAEPTEAMTFTSYGVTDFEVQYWDGSSWQAAAGASAAGNNKVWRKFTFPAVTASKVRVLVTGALAGYSRLTEVEAWGPAGAAQPPAGASRSNHALSANGGAAAASSSYSTNYPAASVNNGDRRGLNWNSGGGWNDATGDAYPDWVEVSFAGPRNVDEVSVFTIQDAPATPAEPTEAMTFTKYGVTAFRIQYWDGAAWADVPGGSVAGNDRVWRKFTFPAVTTSKVRVTVTAALAGYSRIMEVEAWGPAASVPPSGVNHALASNGATATASSSHNSNYPAAAVNNGDRRGMNWNSGGGWNDATPNAYPDWVEIAFAGAKSLTEVSVFTLQDSPGSPAEPTEAMTFASYGVTDFEVQYWDGSAWLPIPGASAAGNNKVWRKFTFPALTTTKIRVVVTGALAGYSRLTEVEAY